MSAEAERYQDSLLAARRTAGDKYLADHPEPRLFERDGSFTKEAHEWTAEWSRSEVEAVAAQVLRDLKATIDSEDVICLIPSDIDRFAGERGIDLDGAS